MGLTYLHKGYQNKDNVSLSVLNYFYRVMYVRIGVRGSNRGIVIGTRMTRFQDHDKANVCTFASELINSQPLSALTRLHLKIENTLSALMRLNLKIAKKSGCLHLNVWKKTDFPFHREKQLTKDQCSFSSSGGNHLTLLAS